jgi:high-affinity K+ transport system ATPase subunit B
MFEGLEWKNAFKRAAIFVGIWLALIYIFKTAFPGYVNLSFDSSTEIVTFLAYPVVFFFLFAVFTAFAERSKKRRFAQLKAQKKKPGARAARATGGSGAAGDDEDTESSRLKGRYNPNTSRKKAARRRRR